MFNTKLYQNDKVFWHWEPASAFLLCKFLCYIQEQQFHLCCCMNLTVSLVVVSFFMQNFVYSLAVMFQSCENLQIVMKQHQILTFCSHLSNFIQTIRIHSRCALFGQFGCCVTRLQPDHVSRYSTQMLTVL